MINIYSADYHDTIYQTYATLRDEHPVYYDEQRNIWMLTRYDDVKAALRDTARFRSAGTSQDFVPQLQATDDQTHKSARSKVIGEFSQKVVAELAPEVDRIIEMLFNELKHNKTNDAINILDEVIKELPRRFISAFLGFPDHLRQRWYDLGEPLVGLDPKNPDIPSDTLFRDVIDVIDEAVEYKREHRSDDLLSRLLNEYDDGKLDKHEVSLFARTLGFASLDTTINLLANGTVLLARFPEQRRALIDNPELVDNAIEEMLRMESPTQALPRRLADDVEFHGITIASGEEVSLVFGAANMDPRKYENADAFDIERKNFDHLAFGFGVHKCIGQYLARMEARAYFKTLLQVLPDYKVEQARWMISPWARAYAELTISA